MLLKKTEPEVPRLVTVIEELKDGFCTINIEGGFIYTNIAAVEMLEIGDNKNDFNFFQDVVQDDIHIDYIKKALDKDGYLKDYELELSTVEDNKFPVILTINHLKDPANNIIGMSVLIKDMTYIKRVQQQLLQAQKMESIGMLASGVAHEFNNILTGIIPNAELIKMTLDTEDTNYSRADAIQNSAYRAAEIVKKLLNFARSDKDKKKEVVNFVQSARETIDIIRKLFDRRIEIDVNFPEDLYSVKLDATSLQQIIMNLSINAKDAIEGEGKISFSAQNISVEDQEQDENKHLPPGDYIKFKISDTGHGIDNERIKFIFDPFFTTKGPGKGTGLGLSMVYGIVNSVSGRIEVRSKAKSGTVFTIYLPATKVEKKLRTSEYKIEPFGEGKTILVVDDEDMIREMASDMLNLLGFKVHLASSGVEGLDLYKRHKDQIDVVLLDLLMPEMNGTACFENLKQVDPEVKVIIATGIGEFEKKKELEEKGIKGYLGKPYRLENIAQKLMDILN
jgi:signal transduction histidine kinase/CheY-like chemotaxis protein